MEHFHRPPLLAEKGGLIDPAREKRIRAAVEELGGLARSNPRLRRRMIQHLRTEERMARPRKEKDQLKKMTAFRLEPELLEALENAGELLAQRLGGGMGPSWSKVDVLRYAIRKLIADMKRGPEAVPSQAEGLALPEVTERKLAAVTEALKREHPDVEWDRKGALTWVIGAGAQTLGVGRADESTRKDKRKR